MRKKIAKQIKSISEYDSQRETGVLLEEMNKGIKIIAEQHGGIVKRLDNIESKLGSVESKLGSLESKLGSLESKLGFVGSKLGSVESELGSIKMAVMEVDSKLTISISRNDERFRKIEEKLCLN